MTVKTVKLGLGTLEVTRDDSETNANDGGPVTDTKALTPERTDSVVIDGKTYTRYTAYVPNYLTHTEGGKLVYDDVIRNAILKALGEENAEVTVTPVPGTAITGSDGEWHFDMVNREACTQVLVTVAATPYAADGSTDGAGHVSTALERTFVVDIYRQDNDTSLLSGGVKYDWLEYIHIGDSQPTKLEDNLLKTGNTSQGTEYKAMGNTLPEAVSLFNVTAAANSPSAKVLVQLWNGTEADFIANVMPTLDFTKAANSVRVTDLDLWTVDSAEGVHGQVVITVESSTGKREAHFFDMERVVKTVLQAGITGSGVFTDVEEYLDMNGYLAQLNGNVAETDREPVQVEKDSENASRVITAVADPKVLAAGTVNLTAMLYDDAAKKGILNLQGLLGGLDADLTTVGQDAYRHQLAYLTNVDLSFSRDKHGNLYAQVRLLGAESSTPTGGLMSDFRYNTEYIKLVEWNDNADLESVTVVYTDENGVQHTAPAYLVDTNNDGKLDEKDDYVIYVSDTIKSVDSVTAVTVDIYANVKIDGDYARHEVTSGEITLNKNGDKVAETDQTIRVLPSMGYYDEQYGKDWNLKILPVDLSLITAEFFQFNAAGTKADGLTKDADDDHIFAEIGRAHV